MTHDWTKPTTTSTKTNFPTEIRNGFLSLGKRDFSGDTNVPTGFMQYNHSTKKFQEYNGSTWLTSTVHDLIPDKTSADTISGNWDYSTASWLKLPADIRLKAAADTTIGIQTTDGADSCAVHVSSASTPNNARGAYLSLYGNEYGVIPGQAYLSGGGNNGAMFWATPTGAQMRGSNPGIAGGGLVSVMADADPTYPGQTHIWAGNQTASKIRNRLLQAGHVVEYEYAGNVSHWFGENQLMHNGSFSIQANTSSGSDNRSLWITPCTSSLITTSLRAAYLKLHGKDMSPSGTFKLGGLTGSEILCLDSAGGTGTLNINANAAFGAGVTMTVTDGQLTASAPWIQHGFTFASGANTLSSSNLANVIKIRCTIDGSPYGLALCSWP